MSKKHLADQQGVFLLLT